MIRVMLVDDHTMVREALRTVLEQTTTMDIVGEVGDGETALRTARQCSPDVVVMDVALPGLSGIETTRRLLTNHPKMKVLALSTYLDRSIVEQMIEAGATGYVLKSAAGDELRTGIMSVMQGHGYFSAEVKVLLGDHPLGRKPQFGQVDIATLTNREREVIKLLAQGKTAPDIANDLFISPRTVEVHRRNIMQKLELHNVVELTKYAIQTGLILN